MNILVPIYLLNVIISIFSFFNLVLEIQTSKWLGMFSSLNLCFLHLTYEQFPETIFWIEERINIIPED